MDYLPTTGDTESCRFCHEANSLFVSLINNPHVLDEIESFLSIKIEIDEEAPKVLCYRCLYKIQSGLEIRQQCLKSEHEWRQSNSMLENLEPQYGLEPTVRDFETFSEQNRMLLTCEKEIEDVIKVVDPNKDYESDSDDNQSNINCISPKRQDHHGESIENGNGELKPKHFEIEYRDEITDLKEFNITLCKYCDKAFTNNEQRNQHETYEHNSKIPYMCNDCMIGYCDSISYSNHLKMAHQNDKPFECVDCRKCFCRRAELRKHSVVHTGLKPFRCNYCSKAFSRNTNLMKHVRIDHSDRRPFGCEQCPKRFNSKSDVSRHVSMTHNSNHRSPNLNNGYQSDGPISETSEPDYNTEDKQHVDDDNSEENLADTMNPEIGPNRYNQYIPIPEHMLTSGYNVASAVNFEEKKKRKYVLKNQEMLNRHICKDCLKRFSSKKTLRYHMLTHKGQQALLCGTCQKKFIRRKDFDRHLYSHSKESAFNNYVVKSGTNNGYA